jgi:hypothetical protein
MNKENLLKLDPGTFYIRLSKNFLRNRITKPQMEALASFYEAHQPKESLEKKMQDVFDLD